MSVEHQSPEADRADRDQTEAPAPTNAAGGGDAVSLPAGVLLAVVGLVGLLGGSAGAMLGLIRGSGAAGWATAGLCAAAVIVGAGASLLAVRPWAAREPAKWPVLVFAAQGGSVLVTLALAGGLGWSLLYSAALLDLVVLLGVLPATWIATWIAVAKVMAAALAVPPGTRPDREPA